MLYCPVCDRYANTIVFKNYQNKQYCLKCFTPYDADELQGEGIRQTFDTIRALLFGQFQLPPSERKLLQQYGEQEVVSINVHREPIKAVPLDRILNVISFGQFSKLMKKFDYDRLFHLYAELTLSSGVILRIEKNERINMKKVEKRLTPRQMKENNAERMSVQIDKPISLNLMIENTSKYMDKDFFPYHPVKNNCQRFITSFLKGNGVLTIPLQEFINQRVDELLNILDPSGALERIASTFTNIGSIGNILIEGGEL